MEPQGEVGIVTVRAKGIRALKEVKSRKVKTGYQLGPGQPWGWATNAKEPTRAPYDKHEGNREAFGYPSALRVVTISLSCTIHVHMRNDMRSGPRILGRQLKKTVIQGGSIAEVALTQEAAALGSLRDLRQTRPPLWASNSVSFRLM